MNPYSDEPISIRLTVQADQPALLEGLEAWLRLGLLSNAEVKQLCRRYLTCELPPALDLDEDLDEDWRVTPVPPAREVVLARTTAPTKATTPLTTPAATPRPASWMVQRLQPLMAEISVIWLLLLGVFMVVVSSGVLAASQWQNVPPIGQYGILLGYTLAFGTASLWAKRQPHLQLTARMLQIATLLIIPVNFWMLDELALWTSGLGGFVAAITGLGLTGLNLYLLRSLRSSSAPEAPGSDRLTQVNSLALSWLHLGWGWTGFPLLATYLGTVGTALTLFYQAQQPTPLTAPPQSSESPPPEALVNSPARTPTGGQRLLPISLVIVCATCLLLGRAVFVAQVPLAQLGLAIGICGWLLCWLPRLSGPSPWAQTGVLLLLAGWLISVTTQPPWQAIAVSGLGLWLLADRLQRLRQIPDLTAMFLVGLQAFALLWRLVPWELRQQILSWGGQILDVADTPWLLLGVAVFPYVGLALLLSDRLRHWRQPELALHGERLAFGLGIVLTYVSLESSGVRSLNLLLSAVALILVTYRRSQAGQWLIYLTHGVGLVAIVAVIDLGVPNLSPLAWAGILLAGMVAEWGFTLSSGRDLWRLSAWHLGLALSGLSYVVLLDDWNQYGGTWGWIWLITPVALTALAYFRQFERSRLAAWLSIGALAIVQPLTLGFLGPRLIMLGLATALMLLNTRRVQHLLPAALTIAAGLGFIGAILQQWLGRQATFGLGVNLLAIAALALWGLRQWLRQARNREGHTPALNRLYAIATDGWAIALVTTSLLFLTAYNLFVYTPWAEPNSKWVVGAGLTILALGYRNWQQPSNVGFYGLAWGLELGAASIIAVTSQSWEHLALANLGLGLLTQILGDGWVRYKQQTYRVSWHVVPLMYALLGAALQHSSFTAFTGLYTLGAALIGIGVGRRHPGFKPLTYFSVLVVTVAAYELLIYQLMQATGGSAGDGIVLLALLGIVLAIAQRLLTRWLIPYLRLDPPEIKAIANFHWAISSSLMLLALFSPLSGMGERLWIAVAGLLAIYALIQGRSSSTWTYTGIITTAIAISYLLYLLLPGSVLVAWGAAIACVFAVGMYLAPWETWGWPKNPWQQSALWLPGVAVFLTSGGIATQGLLITAALYAWFAKAIGRVRLSYLSLLLANWAIIQRLMIYGLRDPFWYSALLGGSLLYVAQVDPKLRSPDERNQRHLLRSLAVALISITALYESETSLLFSLLTLGLSLGLILAGLSLRVRAFLYIGTATFIITVLRQLWLLIADYSFLLWAIGIVMGLALIWVAATFEARRTQVVALMQYWVGELEAWD